MKSASTLLIILFAMVSTAFGQIKVPIANDPQPKLKESYPIDGTHLLKEDFEIARKYVLEHPNWEAQMKLEKATAWNFTVGNTKTWWAQDFVTNSRYQVPSTCRKVGTNCYIFVEDASWNTKVTQTGVDLIEQYFDSKTPVNSSKGIYQTDVETFGNPPDIDSDPKIVILIMDLKDGYDGTGGYIAGYFSSINEVQNTQSNKAEIYYLDCNPLDFTKESGLNTAISTTAHEFQHMIFYNYHKTMQQATFINEGCSLLAEVNCGFSMPSQSGQYGYNVETNHFLFDWRESTDDNVLRDYSRAARFFTYLRDQYGIGIFKKIVASQQFGTDAIIEGVASSGTTITFANLFTNFAMANIVDDKSINQAYGYTYQNIPKPVGTIYSNANQSSSSGVHYLGVDYITFNLGSNLKMQVNSQASSGLVVKALLSGAGGKKVVDVPLNTQFSEPGFGSTYSTATFAVINPVQTFESGTTTAYSDTSSATAPTFTELKWDNSEPRGVLPLAANDTVCVTFNAVTGGKLDSIRVALRYAGSITGGVYEFTGVSQPTPLGKALAKPITASINTTSAKPYPVPFQNWTGVDLRSYNISTDKPFAVAFAIGSSSTVPGIMVTSQPDQSEYHSFTYYGESSQGANWYVLTAGTDSSWYYLIRAYVSFTSDVKTETKELVPASFKVAQNYPNPFNPATNISYSLPEGKFVRLKVYDMLGKEVATLVNEYKPAGNYSVQFNASSLPSGIYLYKIDAGGNFIETHKMVLMK
ncbi:MAG: T9SS type A sorting domain-containing protein [Bacteroidota bacterium]|nr:T9SS type A sorting domain-containing protein [Bacteroidota bacterium]